MEQWRGQERAHSNLGRLSPQSRRRRAGTPRDMEDPRVGMPGTPVTEVSREGRGRRKPGIKVALWKRAPSGSCGFRRGTQAACGVGGGVPRLSSLCSPAGSPDNPTNMEGRRGGSRPPPPKSHRAGQGSRESGSKGASVSGKRECE